MEQYNGSSNNDSSIQEESLDLRKIILRFTDFWPWFVVSLFLALSLAFFNNKFSTPSFRASSTILIKEDKGYRRTNNLISNLDIFGSQTNIQNEIGILQSYSLHYRTVENLGLYISYNRRGKYREKDAYGICPFVVLPDTSRYQAINVEVGIVAIGDNKVRVTTKFDDIIHVIKYSTGEVQKISTNKTPNEEVEIFYGELYQNDFFSFRVFPTNESEILDGGDYFIIFNNTASVTSSFRSRFSAEPLNKESSIVRISVSDLNPKRAVDYLNVLGSNYINMGLSEKNLIASKTIDFIDEQLMGITDTLSTIEKNLAEFRTDNKIVDLSAQGQAIFSKLQNLEYEKSMEQMKVGYYTYLLNYVESDTSGLDLIAPSAIGISDPLLTQLISELSQLYTTREQLKATSSAKNPYLTDINVKIETLRRSIVENVTHILANAKFILAEKQKELNRVQAELQMLPQTERQLISIERMFTVNDQIYTFLLEKRAEAAIAKASNIADHKVIDDAMVDGQIRPKKKQNYIIAFLLGLLIPAVVFFIYDQIRNTIKDLIDVESLSKTPILGNVLHNDEGYINVKSLSEHVVDSFRAIRTNLDFFVANKEKKIISITSINPGEGKSFCSMHLAYVFALAGKKTLLIGADIRKPDLGNFLNISGKKGLTTFLSFKDEFEDVIVSTKIENLDFIPAGPIPPNPAEMLSSSNIERVFDKLENYDVVIFDTSPIGIIADAAYILRMADINLFVARYHVSRKSDIKAINQIIQKLNVQHPAIVCNDLKRKGRKYNYHYYYYGGKKG